MELRFARSDAFTNKEIDTYVGYLSRYQHKLDKDIDAVRPARGFRVTPQNFPEYFLLMRERDDVKTLLKKLRKSRLSSLKNPLTLTGEDESLITHCATLQMSFCS